uniref:ParB/RepB/Spo0J family partition protein n=1 Tax=uncultured Sphingomonas sp. TaxID=158754 RepID=UPI0035CB842E
MKLAMLPLGKLKPSKTNMRYGRKAPDVSDLLPSVRKHGILQSVLVRPEGDSDEHGVVAGLRRYHAACIVAEETGTPEPVPCAILEEGDDAAAIEASLIENLARLDPDEVTQWATFTRLVREGGRIEDIATTFAMPDLAVKRILALGNLLPRIRTLYASDAIDRATVRHLTLASKSQQKAWLALVDDPEQRAPAGHQVKAWLFGGQSIAVSRALFDVATYGGAIVADLFGEDRYFADTDAFWVAQNAEIEARRVAYLGAGWADVVLVPATEPFASWEYEKAPKRKGGRVYVDVRSTGEVVFHEGYISRKQAARIAKGDTASGAKAPPRPELTATMQTYIDLHRHAAVRAALTSAPHVAVRLMAAHAIAGSHLWAVRVEPQTTRSDAVAESVENGIGEAEFDARRRSVLAVLGFAPDEPTVLGGTHDDTGVVGIFLRLLDLPDAAVMDVIAVVMGESLAAGSAAVEAVGLHLGVRMERYWQADPALLDLIRDREVLLSLVAEVAGPRVADANAGEKGKTLRQIVADHLAGAGGRIAPEHWVPRWMTFPPSAYTTRGGVGTVRAHALVEAARPADPPVEPDGESAAPDPDNDSGAHALAA